MRLTGGEGLYFLMRIMSVQSTVKPVGCVVDGWQVMVAWFVGPLWLRGSLCWSWRRRHSDLIWCSLPERSLPCEYYHHVDFLQRSQIILCWLLL